MTEERTYTAVLLNANGTVLDEQERSTEEGVPVSPLDWTTKGLDGLPVTTYAATLTDNPHPGQGDDNVYYRAGTPRKVFGPAGAPTINQHHDATPQEESTYTAVLEREDGETTERWFSNQPTRNGLIPERITVLNEARTVSWVYERSHLVALDRAVFKRGAQDVHTRRLRPDEETQFDIVL